MIPTSMYFKIFPYCFALFWSLKAKKELKGTHVESLRVVVKAGRCLGNVNQMPSVEGQT